MGGQPGQSMKHSCGFVKSDLNKINIDTLFRVEGEDKDYQLLLKAHSGYSGYGYSGTAGDSLSYINWSKFSTRDRKNDGGSRNCGQIFKGGWWFNQ